MVLLARQTKVGKRRGIPYRAFRHVVNQAAPIVLGIAAALLSFGGMRAFLSFTLSIPFAVAYAQPTLGPHSFFQPEHGYLRFSYDIQPDHAAELIAADGDLYAIDLAWVNFATLYTSDSIVCGPAPDTYLFHNEDYDTANVQVTFHDRDLGGVRTHLFLVSDDSVKYVGGQPNGGGDTGDDLVFQRYPNRAFETILFPNIEYGTTWSDTIDGQFLDASGSDDHFLHGISTTTADGAGSITMPDGTYLPHTLRLRTVRDYMDMNAVFGDMHRQDTLYTWWVDSWDAPLMTLPIGSYGMTHGYVSPLPFTIYRRLGVVQQVGIAEDARNDLLIGPNPCSDRLYVQGSPRGAYAILDASGRVVRQGTTMEATIDVSRLANGTYSLAMPGSTAQRARFVVAR